MRDFRSYEAAELALGPGLTIVHGANGAGKTNLLEALYFGCTGALVPHRQRAQPRALRRDQPRGSCCPARDADGPHELAVGLRARRAEAHDAATARRSSGCSTSPHRPLASVFSPDRLELIKGQPGLRRAHLDQFVAALWPGRARDAPCVPRGARAAQRAACARARRPLGRRRARTMEPRRWLRPAWRSPQIARAASERIEAGFSRARPGARASPARRRSPTARVRGPATPPQLAEELAERARRRPRPRLHDPRPAPRRSRVRARRARTARVRIAGRAAARAAGAAAGRARRAGGGARAAAADAARRRDERARPRAPRAAGRRAAPAAARAWSPRRSSSTCPAGTAPTSTLDRGAVRRRAPRPICRRRSTRFTATHRAGDHAGRRAGGLGGRSVGEAIAAHCTPGRRARRRARGGLRRGGLGRRARADRARSDRAR